ncbi:Gfo/Idh/MocA family protein [Paenibacillus flagellatus]|uniref:Gfo/Idh/MocA family oxidoreductase n=1 Tax=Paenibacillus flagellatus TaxID=2211139 RepID=A0A2V5KSC4_9BACL|nr:Gfo/Idh/MocA family oxidoreductase [Paenibacillus flagellatus]PYI51916.1 gfo/Idh/MocA family oxidoreductase [Paenibacillus flagellatus]
MKRWRWGVLGTGNIVAKGGAGIQRSANGEWLGVAGRNPENGRRAAETYGVPRAYAGYRELLDDPDIDAVYIALLNHLHLEWALEAVKAGKHVLLEKPFALNERDARIIVEAARSRGVRVEEAFVWRHMEGHAAAREAIRDGKIGEPVFFRGHFSFTAAGNSTRLVEEWGGGALYDIGCYLVAWSRYQFGEEPTYADCRFTRDEGTRLDRRFAGTLAFPGGGTAHMTGAIDMPYGCGYEIKGTRGGLEVRQFADAGSITLQVTLNGETRDFVTDRIEPFRLQAERFAERAGASDPMPDGGEAILAQARVMDALFASGDEGGRVRVKTGSA